MKLPAKRIGIFYDTKPTALGISRMLKKKWQTIPTFERNVLGLSRNVINKFGNKGEQSYYVINCLAQACRWKLSEGHMNRKLKLTLLQLMKWLATIKISLSPP
jgi:hypothetical protein